MREIKFRGLSVTTGEWHYGNLTILINDDATSHDKGSYISNSGGGRPFAHEVRPETVSQYTGLKDKDGERIFEEHILKNLENADENYCGDVVRFYDGQYRFGKSDIWGLSQSRINHMNIIGNIHENPELLNKEK